MKCECGSEEFAAHQQVYVDIIVDGDNIFERNLHTTLNESIYESGNPYGPYTCIKCGKKYDELTN